MHTEILIPLKYVVHAVPPLEDVEAQLMREHSQCRGLGGARRSCQREYPLRAVSASLVHKKSEERTRYLRSLSDSNASVSHCRTSRTLRACTASSAYTRGISKSSKQSSNGTRTSVRGSYMSTHSLSSASGSSSALGSALRFASCTSSS